MTGLRTEYEQRRLDFAAERLKFIDETGMNLAMTRLYGRAAPGVRVVDHVPHNYGENISLLAALGLAGLSAPMTVAGAVDAAVFRTYVEQVLGPDPEAGRHRRVGQPGRAQGSGDCRGHCGPGRAAGAASPIFPRVQPN